MMNFTYTVCAHICKWPNSIRHYCDYVITNRSRLENKTQQHIFIIVFDEFFDELQQQKCNNKRYLNFNSSG